MVNTIVKMAVELFLREESKAVEDTTNNSKNDFDGTTRK